MTIDKIQESWGMRMVVGASSVLTGLAVIAGGLAWMFGGFNGIIIVQHDMLTFGKQITDLSASVASLSMKIDLLPRQQDMEVVNHHLNALDARSDGIEGRLRQVENNSTADHAKIEGIIGTANSIYLTPSERRR
jgi:hypothetical protein